MANSALTIIAMIIIAIVSLGFGVIEGVRIVLRVVCKNPDLWITSISRYKVLGYLSFRWDEDDPNFDAFYTVVEYIDEYLKIKKRG